MTRRKGRQDHFPPIGDVSLSKPDFERVLSFAEAAQSSAMLPDHTVPEVVTEFVEAASPVPVMERMTHKALPVATAPRQSAAALMPQDAATRVVLEERAQVMAKPPGQQHHEVRDQYLRFRLGAVERYGIPYQYLEGLSYVGNLARVPCTPAFVAGVVNRRGELLTILDLKYFFRMPTLATGGDARIIVLKYAGMRLGLLVDAVDGNVEYQNSELSPPLGSEGVLNMEYVLGIHKGCVTILNLKALLDDPLLRVSR